MGKVLEGILRDKIYLDLERQGQIRDSQHGFVHGKTCLINSIVFSEEVTKRIDEDRMEDMIYMDFSKAFDKIPHARLVGKVRSHGIQGELATWIQSWLE
eukprot:g22557.t1